MPVRGRAPLRNELLAGLEYRRLRRSGVLDGAGIPDGDGQPVLLVPGFLSTDLVMQVMRLWLRRIGYRAFALHAPINLGCGERGVGHLERRAEELVATEGARLALIGHSRGGQFARVLGVRRPDLVSGVVTLAMPPLDPLAIHPLAAGPAIAVTALGTLGVPGVMRASCFRGACCARFRADLEGPFPDDVDHVAVHSRDDAIVAYHRIRERDARRIDVRASHAGIVVNADAYRAIARALPPFWPQPTTSHMRGAA